MEKEFQGLSENGSTSNRYPNPEPKKIIFDFSIFFFIFQGAQKYLKSLKSRGRKISPLQSFFFEKATGHTHKHFVNSQKLLLKQNNFFFTQK